MVGSTKTRLANACLAQAPRLMMVRLLTLPLSPMTMASLQLSSGDIRPLTAPPSGRYFVMLRPLNSPLSAVDRATSRPPPQDGNVLVFNLADGSLASSFAAATDAARTSRRLPLPLAACAPFRQQQHAPPVPARGTGCKRSASKQCLGLPLSYARSARWLPAGSRAGHSCDPFPARVPGTAPHRSLVRQKPSVGFIWDGVAAAEQ